MTTLQSSELKHFPAFLLEEVSRLKHLDAEEELLYTKGGLPEGWVWTNEPEVASILEEGALVEEQLDLFKENTLGEA